MFTSNPDPRTFMVETEVSKILHLQKIVDQTLDGFHDAPRITRNPLNETHNLPAQVSMPDTITTPTLQLIGKRTRGSDKQPRKRKAIIDAIRPSLPIATNADFTKSLTNDYPSTSKRNIFVHEQK